MTPTYCIKDYVLNTTADYFLQTRLRNRPELLQTF